jgi:hypothetical protein
MDEGSVSTIFTFVFIAFVVVVIGVVVFRTLVSIRWNRHRAKTVGKWSTEGIEFILGPVGSQFGGFESSGNVDHSIGLAVMTDKDFRITRAATSESWCITYKQIKGVSTRSNYLGYTAKKTPFIVVRFVKDGKKDKLGFQINNYEAWAEELAQAANVTLKDFADE